MLIMTALPKQGNNILINNKEENTMSKTSIGLDKKASEKLAAKLNELLATYQVTHRITVIHNTSNTHVLKKS